MFHYVRRAFEGIENYYHSYGSLPYQSEYSFQNCALFLSSFTAAGEFRYKLSHTDSGGGAYAYYFRPQHLPQHTDFRIPSTIPPAAANNMTSNMYSLNYRIERSEYGISCKET